MKTTLLVILSVFVFPLVWGQGNLEIRTHLQEWNDSLFDIWLEFDSDSDRRYLIQSSNDLNEWGIHYLSPFEYSRDGYWVRQVDRDNPFDSNREFFRVYRLPWSFQVIVESEDWIGDLSLAGSGDGAFLVFQNRETNELCYTKSDLNGHFEPAVVIAATGAIDEGSIWDNSGFAEVSLLYYNETLFLVCTDSIAQKVVLLWKSEDSVEWNRHEISEAIDVSAWAFPKFSISDTGVLGVAYASDSGTVFSYASSLSPTVWNMILVTTDKPNSSNSIKTAFGEGSDAHVYVRNSGSFVVNMVTDTVTAGVFPDDPVSDLSEEEIEKIGFTYRYETVSKHVRLNDGRILFGLSHSSRIVIAVEDE